MGAFEKRRNPSRLTVPDYALETTVFSSNQRRQTITENAGQVMENACSTQNQDHVQINHMISDSTVNQHETNQNYVSTTLISENHLLKEELAKVKKTEESLSQRLD